MVREQLARLVERHPPDLVDFVPRAGLAVARHPVVPHLLRALRNGVLGSARLLTDRAAKPRLLLDLTECALLPGLAALELPFGKRPVVVLGAVHHEHAAVTEHDAPRGANHQTSIRSASPW